MKTMTKLEAFSDHCWDLLRQGERIKLDTELFVDLGIEGVWISKLLVPRRLRGQGYARWAMNQICQAADEESIVLILDACPFDVGGLSVEALTTFYESFGFELNGDTCDGNIMVRQPNA